MLQTFILFIIGFYILVKGADFLVDGAGSIADRFKIPHIVIGLTVVAFGTSLPELVVNIFSSFQGYNDLAIGNVIGSNISNTLLILGIACVIYPLTVKEGTVYKEIPLSLLAVIMLGILINDNIIDGDNYSRLSRIDGLILLSYFLIFIYYTFGISKVKGGDSIEIKQHSLLTSCLLIFAGIIGLTLGGKWIVDGAIVIARFFLLSEALIGLTIIAIGTSLPELAATATAAYKKNPDMAIGNIVGSNIFNVFLVLGVSASIKTIDFSTALNTDIIIVILITLLLFVFMHTGSKHRLTKMKGWIFLGMYAIYMVFLVWRG